MACQVAILAGGMGTRLRERTGDLPKPMASVLGRPILEHQIQLCKRFGFDEIALLVHFRADAVQEYFGDGSRFGVSLTYVLEQEARGTAGALRDALDVMNDRFVVLYADTYADIDLARLWAFDREISSAGTLLLHPNDHPQDSDLVSLTRDSLVSAIHPYPHPDGATYRNLVNAALYVLEKAPLFKVIPATGKHDLAKHTFPEMLRRGLLLRGYVTPEYIKDMGTPERLDKVERDIVSGLPERLSTRHHRTAVFLDRDGTLNKEVNHLSDCAQLELLPGAAKAVHRLNRSGVLAVCVTNQPVIARGELSFEDLDSIHARLDELLGREKAFLDGIYACPHHPESGFEGEVKELKIVCTCRKPETGMLDTAIKDFAIDRKGSWIVGDTTSDILAGKRAGLQTALVRTGYGGTDRKYPATADFEADTLDDAIDWILTGRSRMVRALLPIVGSLAESRMVLIGGASKTGKTSTSRLLAHLYDQIGRTAHVISLDAWLRPELERKNGIGLLARYDTDGYVKALTEVVVVGGREQLLIPMAEGILSTVSIGPKDVLIVEGVTALVDERLRELTGDTVYLGLDGVERRARFQRAYQARGLSQRQIDEKFESRELDEVDLIRRQADSAKFQIFIRGLA
ncbi:d,D-heptose 1,7-bisphosphate phosphatase [Pandoraea cepalis]|uniref:D,D-heptose 1,7-bisphosphate phosphatase n=1 Tax=Pandoraea cepalis TaxID=2508294 RepID=A0A5E4YLX5_9BURK|nr:HAD-IIIA family hydrolase [Pandoraea cepalis]VVE49370.1 d,D-heptose 1,7-bisphosphate phosphatase [Pandoraea cepalis]